MSDENGNLNLGGGTPEAASETTPEAAAETTQEVAPETTPVNTAPVIPEGPGLRDSLETFSLDKPVATKDNKK